jgi:hypothetical protein
MSYTPADASPGLPSDTYDLHQYHNVRSSSGGSRREDSEVWVPTPPYSGFANAGFPHVPYSDEIRLTTAIHHPRYYAYQFPQQNSYSHPTIAPDFHHMSFLAHPDNQAPNSQAPNSKPVQIDIGKRSAVCVVLPREAVHPYARYPRTPRYVGAEPDSHIIIPLDSEVPVKPKPKRKKADSAQLEVLNRTYQCTAFPSTEERAQLAVELGMLPRSVQIWYVQGFDSGSSIFLF